MMRATLWWPGAPDGVRHRSCWVCRVPSAFQVATSHLTPSTRTATPAPTPAFLADFLSVLALNGCDGLFGIDTIAKAAWSEMSIGDASVVVPSNDSDGYNQDKF